MKLYGRVAPWAFLAVLVAAPSGFTQPAASDGGCGAAACPPFEGEIPEASEPSLAPVPADPLLFFWGVGCPHCEDAKPFLDELSREMPTLVIERIEVRKDRVGRERFLRKVEALQIQAPGIPLFVYDQHYLVGFSEGVTESQLRDIIRSARSTSAEGHSETVGRVVLPIVGSVDPSRMSMPAFTLLVGLLDGINPCAMWVLLVLLGLLLHVRSRRRLFLFGGVFVVMSGVVYFLFMTVWHGLFGLIGFSRWITIGLGVVVATMGLINLKELFWLKKGVSLTIPDQVKPRLYRRMRVVANATSLPAALLGVIVLAFLVNLIELGCTLGLPAIYTRILSMRTDLSPAAHYGYLALYNVAYVVPLALVVVLFAGTLHRFVLKERGTKVLKGVSGVLLLLFGLLFIVAPELLG